MSPYIRTKISLFKVCQLRSLPGTFTLFLKVLHSSKLMDSALLYFMQISIFYLFFNLKSWIFGIPLYSP